MTPFLLGDIFVQNDPPYVPGVSYGDGATVLPGSLQFNAMCLAWHDPIKRRIGARLDRLAGIWRPAGSPATLDDSSPYWKSTNDNDQPLVLVNGAFSFDLSGSGEASMVPIGMISQHRTSEAIFTPSVPGVSDLKPSRWMAYIPPLTGYQPTEGDALLTQDGARYVISSPYSQEAGVVGSICLVERKISQAA